MQTAEHLATDTEPKALEAIWFEMAFAIENIQYYQNELPDIRKPQLARRYEMFATASDASALQPGPFFEDLARVAGQLRDICFAEGVRRGLVLALGNDPQRDPSN